MTQVIVKRTNIFYGIKKQLDFDILFDYNIIRYVSLWINVVLQIQ